MTDIPDISLIVLSWNTLELTRACLRELDTCQAASHLKYEIVVIDNHSEDGSADMIANEFPHVQLTRNQENVGYARGVNQGLGLASGRLLTLLGSDTEVRPGTLEHMERFLAEHPRVGVVAPRLVSADGSPQRACMRFPDLKVALAYDTAIEGTEIGDKILDRYKYMDWDHLEDASVDQPPGTCLMVRRQVFETVGPMDRMLWLFFNDVDWCLRIRRAGWDIWYLHEGTEVLHHIGQSTSRFPTFPFEWHKNRLHFYRKHYHSMGVFFIKLAMVYIAGREVLRIRRNLEDTREFMRHASQVLRALGGVMLM
ncbi:MAG: N-acetylglucosaminyl-diphospho-decaprenol L-rhamnosyltransferase [Planctomycetota bacterium]|jgi:N-acetylglucosaminyl-diphospho-decaprenol L-rhamnosyltransferase